MAGCLLRVTREDGRRWDILSKKRVCGLKGVGFIEIRVPGLGCRVYRD